MEEQQGLAALFPNPPPFWQDFTPEKIEKITDLREKSNPSASKMFDPAKELPPRILDLPTELRFLQPPALPESSIYKVFGDTYNLEDPLPSLEDYGVTSLYRATSPTTENPKPFEDHAFILKKLIKSALLNFLELVGIMSDNPVDGQEKIDDLRTIFINFHHLLNTYRPHQARESLILLMQAQLDTVRKETQGIKDMKVKVEGVLEGLAQTGLVEEEAMVIDAKAGYVEEGRDVWEELEKCFE